MRRLLLALVSLAFLLIAVDERRLPPAPRQGAFDDPDQAAAFFALKRGITAGTDVHALYAAARAHLARMAAAETRMNGRFGVNERPATSIGAWSFLGPGNVGGRTRALLVDPNEPNVMYAGAVSGGVWKSTNAGASWTPLGDLMSNLAVCALAFDPGDPSTLYAGTGEGYFREDVRGTALTIAGDGVFVTHDGGATWHQLSSTAGNVDFQFVNDVAVTGQGLYAATRSGVWRSLDRGTSWSRVLPTTVKGGCLDLALSNAGGGATLLASCGIFEQATVYRNTAPESDAPWSAVLTDPSMGRTSLAVAPSDPNVVYALAACNAAAGSGCHDQGLLGVYRSDRAGAAGSWSAQTTYRDSDRVAQTLLSNRTAALNDICNHYAVSWSNMGWHCNVIAVDPTDPNRVWAGGVDLFRSDDGGRTWGEASYWDEDDEVPQYAHADQHVIVFHPRYDGASNRTMFFANDGGLFRSDNALDAVAMGPSGPCDAANTLVHFTSLNHNYGVTQFYSGAVLPDGSRWLGGAQDNGTVIGDTTAGIDGWQQIFGGDGGTVAVDPVSPRTLYMEYQYATMARSDDGGLTRSPLRSGSSNFLFIAPYILDPNDHRRLFLGGTQLLRSDDRGTSWTNAGASVGSGKISAIAATPARAGFVLAGTTAGAILRGSSAVTSNTAAAWQTTKPRDGFVSSIAIDPSNPDTAYATYAGFGGGAHVWRTLDGGATWSPLDGSGDLSVPNIPVHSVVIEGERLFLGTDLGILVSTDGGATWRVDGGFPAVIAEALVIGQGVRGRALYAFTHGRGAWRADFNGPQRRRAAGR